MTMILQSITRADAEIRYLTPGEMEQIKAFLMSGEWRLKLVKILTASCDVIIQKAAKELLRRLPNLASVRGNAYGEEMTATCLRDMDDYLRLVTYSIATGEPNPLEAIGTIGARQMHQF